MNKKQYKEERPNRYQGDIPLIPVGLEYNTTVGCDHYEATIALFYSSFGVMII